MELRINKYINRPYIMIAKYILLKRRRAMLLINVTS